MSTEQAIQSRITDRFSPAHAELVNESYKHNVPAGSESHFRLTLVSERFADLSPVRRHQLVYGELKDFMAPGGVHALALHTFTPEEWAEEQGVRESPDCMGGKGGANPAVQRG
ncbi:BolA family protein [Allohahella sp. A8]|uniref:BolA family protein n=1 Tax=Allohahella sp. A8 TaxID=3141461 RepID=UPI000C09F109|nr:BolA family transcriptional regulator [Hahellaceae bacterium]|tara:strand:- start:35641 stop:35979 length:339 start_codon:yes stop_codon:yes gene_type:complete